MKKIRSLAIFFLLSTLFGSCFDPPEYPNTPKISFEKIEFYKGEAMDSLLLYIRFQDGDGDLGFDGSNTAHFSYPYNSVIFFQQDNGNLKPVYTEVVTSTQGIQYEILQVSGSNDLVFPRTRKKPEYSHLPAFDQCVNYMYLRDRNLLVWAKDTVVLDKYTRFTDTLYAADNTPLYQIQDTLYIHHNPNHYNIEIDFLIQDLLNPNADPQGFVEFDWRRETCSTFDGRFPLLQSNNGPLEGTLSYSMRSSGLHFLFSLRKMKLRVQVKDRALHLSNVIETPEFTLDGIRKK